MATEAQILAHALMKLHRLGGWDIERQLGQGGFGLVVQASRRRIDGSQQRAAIKVVNPGNAEVRQAQALLQHEFDVLRRLDSPYIAKVLDSGIETIDLGRSKAAYVPWLATELVKGDSLADEVQEHGPLEKGQWLELAHDMLAGLAQVHAEGVVHSDIKPANVMRYSRKSLLIDFGGASFVSVEDPGDVGVHTLGFAAPEQLDGVTDPSTWDYAIDLFATGATLVFAATGRLPWQPAMPQTGDRRKAMFDAIRTTRPEFSNMDADQQQLVSQMLQFHPKQRGTSADFLARVRDLLPEGSLRKTGDAARPAAAAFPIRSAPTSVQSGAKDFKTAWMLAALLGPFAADHFYLGKYKSGVLKLLGLSTFGWFGIWWWYDIQQLLSGKTLDSRGFPLADREAFLPIAKKYSYAAMGIGAIFILSMLTMSRFYD